MEQIENLINSSVRQHEIYLTVLLNKWKEGVHVMWMYLFFFSNNFNEFQALMQEIKSQGMIMTAFLEEIKHESQSNLENLREMGQPK